MLNRVWVTTCDTARVRECSGTHGALLLELAGKLALDDSADIPHCDQALYVC